MTTPFTPQPMAPQFTPQASTQFMPQGLDMSRLRQEINQMIDALTSPAFVEAMRAVRSAPIEQRLVEGSRRLNPQTLRAQGVPLPPGMRISSRYFEEGLPQPVDFGDPPEGGINLVNALNEAEPGLLDRLRVRNPDVFKELLLAGPESQTKLNAAGGCCCGGAGTACGGCGG